ncbi:MAG: hypothetical protein IJF27_08040 [Oscillospiraceae bacterium]|nr:hypothetical protein [Oscillospiraceae bacterium]MBQ3050171.1 hypothetical protein [Oscillospiraceae bacterium]MBQ9938152.1 hypothetical protein [Oscillospiraceae bacterium]
MEFIIIVLVPLLIAFIVCSIFKAQMKTTGKQYAARVYINEEGLDLTDKIDDFTHTTVSRRRIENK